MTSAVAPFDDIAPVSDELTEYDRAHIKLYMRLLDAADDGAEWAEVVNVLFGIDPVREPERALDDTERLSSAAASSDSSDLTSPPSHQ